MKKSEIKLQLVIKIIIIYLILNKIIYFFKVQINNVFVI